VKRQHSAIALAIILSTAVLTGCSSSPGSSAPSASESAPASLAPANITYAFWGNSARADKVNTVIGLFGEAFPQIQVSPDTTDYASYMERLTVQAAGGALACALGTQSYFYTYYANHGVLASLQPYIDSGVIDVSQIPSDVLAKGQVNGVQYMIPTGSFTRMFAYNQDLITSSGAGMPSNGMTWEQYADWLRAVQKGLPAGVYATEDDGQKLETLISWVLGHGGTPFSGTSLGFSKQTLADFWNFWLGLSNEGVTVPPDQLTAQNGVL